MVRNNQKWELGEPELNERGHPVVHNIASKLGCVRPHIDIDLPVQNVFPEDRAGLTELARQLEEEEQMNVLVQSMGSSRGTGRARLSDLDYSEVDGQECSSRRAFGGDGSVTMSPRSMTYTKLDSETPDSVPDHSPTIENFHPSWGASGQGDAIDFPGQQFLTAAGAGQYMDMDLLNHSLSLRPRASAPPNLTSCHALIPTSYSVLRIP